MKSAEDSKRLAGIAQTRAKTVINLLTGAAASRAAADPAAGEVRRCQPRGADADGIQPVQHQPDQLGGIGTEQFPAPRFSPLADHRRQQHQQPVNFSDLLNLFAFRPDLNIGATIKALQERDLLQILAEPNLIVLEGKDASFLAGGSFPSPPSPPRPPAAPPRPWSRCSSSLSA